MSLKQYHSVALPAVQEVDFNDAAWNEVVSTRLPGDVEAQARSLKAWSRQRGLRCVSDLLRALLVYACCQYSVRELGMWAVLKGIGSLSERAWRKRLDRSRAWIAWLLSDLLGVHHSPEWVPPGAGRVLLIDATRFKSVGGTGDDVRLQQSYDLRAGCMAQVQVTDCHQAESVAHFQVQPGDLVVTDAGYAVGSSVEVTLASQGFVLQRTSVFNLHLEDEQGDTITLKERVKYQAGNSLKEVDGYVDLPKSGKRAKVRVLCYRLSKEQAKKAQERKAAKQRKKHGPGYNQEVVWWAGWVILVTTTPRDVWSGKALVALYRARWQIELFFKRLKQCLRLHQLPVKDWERASCIVHLHLIVWWMQEQEAQWMREVLSAALAPMSEDIVELGVDSDVQEESQDEPWILSSWTLAHFCSEEVRTMLRGAWTRQRKQACQQALRRYVRSHPRQRGHRESEQRAWLEARASQSNSAVPA